MDQRVRAADDLAVAGQDDHLPGGLALDQAEPRGGPLPLQWREAEPARLQQRPGALGEPAAERAMAIVEDPPRGGAFNFIICNICIHRNIGLKKNAARQPPRPIAFRTRSPSRTNLTRAAVGHWRTC